MRIPVKTGGNSINNLLGALTRRKFSVVAVLSLLLGIAGAGVLLAVLMSLRSSSNALVVPDSNANSSNANAAIQPVDDAAIRASKEFYKQAESFYERRKFDKAIETYTLAIELNPNDYAIYNNRGAAYHGAGEYQKAIADYNKALELNPYYSRAYNNRGVAYQEVGSIEQAVADFRKALELDPEDKLAKDNLKRILK